MAKRMIKPIPTVNVIQFKNDQIIDLLSVPANSKGVKAAEDYFSSICLEHGKITAKEKKAYLQHEFDFDDYVEDGDWHVVIFHSTDCYK
jgi:hypothetical protein